MRQAAQLPVRAGCLLSVLGPAVAIVLYPKANWLFAFVLVGVALVVFQIITSKDPSPREMADLAERLLSGTDANWDVDDYEHLNPKDSALNDLWRTTMTIGGLPETWAQLEEEKKSKLRDIIAKLRNMESGQERILGRHRK